MPGKMWWLKVQHDTLQQAYANAALLACPVLLIATNPEKNLSPLEIIGWLGWLGSWYFENKADLQKLSFTKKTETLEASADQLPVCGGEGWNDPSLFNRKV